MNYISVVYAIVVIIMVFDWFLRGRTSYGFQKAIEAEATSQTSVPSTS